MLPLGCTTSYISNFSLIHTRHPRDITPSRESRARARAAHVLSNALPNHFDFTPDNSAIFYLGALGGGEQELLRLDTDKPSGNQGEQAI